MPFLDLPRLLNEKKFVKAFFCMSIENLLRNISNQKKIWNKVWWTKHNLVKLGTSCVVVCRYVQLYANQTYIHFCFSCEHYSSYGNRISSVSNITLSLGHTACTRTFFFPLDVFLYWPTILKFHLYFSCQQKGMYQYARLQNPSSLWKTSWHILFDTHDVTLSCDSFNAYIAV